MLHKNAKIYIAGHRGLVGSAIWKNLQEKGYTNLVGRTHKELDLLDGVAVRRFFDEEQPEYVFRLFLIEETADGNTVQQVEFFVGSAHEIGIAFLLQVFPDSRAYQSAMPCDVYFCVLV